MASAVSDSESESVIAVAGPGPATVVQCQSHWHSGSAGTARGSLSLSLSLPVSVTLKILPLHSSRRACRWQLSATAVTAGCQCHWQAECSGSLTQSASLSAVAFKFTGTASGITLAFTGNQAASASATGSGTLQFLWPGLGHWQSP
jgi:hypothetical protein